MAENTSFSILKGVAAAGLMLIAANCFLAYLWWSACYSAWSGIPRLHDQWLTAGTRASTNGWAFMLLEVASVAVLCTIFRWRYIGRLLALVPITVAGTAMFALGLSWIKQGIR